MKSKRTLRWLYALILMLSVSVGALETAKWLVAELGLPSFVLTSHSGGQSDVVMLAIALGLLLVYLNVAFKLLRITPDEFRKMLRGE